MSIEEVARITRIPRSTLGAIEDGHIAQLPAPVFVRGFIRSYAELVGLDANELLRDLRLGSEPTEAPDALVSTVTSADAVTGSRRSPTLPPYAPLFGDAEPVASSGIGFSHAALIVLAMGMLVAAWLMAGLDSDENLEANGPTPPAIHQQVDGVSGYTRADAGH